MKKLTAVALAAGLIAGAAHAQSSVTLFGVADVGVRHATTSGVGTIDSLVSGSYSSARWGLRGQEDLGGGLYAGFWLESFLAMDTGLVSPAGFQRRSTLSFGSRQWGELRLGRDYTFTHSAWSRVDPFGYVGIGADQLYSLAATGNTPVTWAFGSNPNDVQRINNEVQYLLPQNSWGLEGGFGYAFRENGASSADLHKAVGGRIGWSRGPFSIAVAHVRTHDDIMNGYFKDTVVSGAYDFGVAIVSGGMRREQYQTAKQTNYLVGLRVPLGAHELKASWNRADWDGVVRTTSIGNDRSDQFALGYIYNFSKRTRLYATAATIRNKGNSRYVVPGSPAATANGQSSRGFEVGINQDF